MLAWFPELYEDELLSSAIARYSDVVRYPSEAAVAKEIYGVPSSFPDLPTRLNRFIGILPPGHSYTADYLIDNHSLFPYYSFPLAPSFVQEIKGRMLSNNPYNPYLRLGLSRSRITTPNYFRFCSACVKEDRARFGETYWHRSHQLAGLPICTTHRVWLEQSPVVFRIHGKKSVRYVSAENSVSLIEPRLVDFSMPANQTLLEIAEDATWILKNFGSSEKAIDIRSHYPSILAEQGFATHAHRIYFTKLTEAFEHFCSQDSWSWLNQTVLQPNYTFVKQLVHRQNSVVSAIHHLVFIRFLGFRVQESINYRPEVNLFGTGPWPCLNPICKYYHKLSIRDCKIIFRNNTEADKRIIGIFKCECGYTYRRIGADPNGTDMYRPARSVGVISYGDLWESEFSSTWNDERVSLKKLAQKFNIDKDTAKQHAKRLGLAPGNRVSPVKFEKMAPLATYDPFHDTRAERIEQYRKTWLSMQERNPEASRSQLIKMMNREAIFLRRHDREWYEQNCPQSLPGKKPNVPKWKRLDSELAARLPDARNKLLESRRRITRYGLLLQIGAKEWITRLDKIPNTNRIANELAESPLQAALRRIELTVTECKRLGLQLSRRSLVHRAGVSSYTNLPTVEEAIERAMRDLE